MAISTAPKPSADLLINCAGVAHAGRLMDIPSEIFRTLMDVNYFGTLWVTRAVIPHFVARGNGAIANVASQAAIEGIYSYGAYAVSTVMAPERVEELLHGLPKRRFEITPGVEGKLLYRLHRTWHRPLRAYFDWQVQRGLAD